MIMTFYVSEFQNRTMMRIRTTEAAATEAKLDNVTSARPID
jgi:hypothetical protein